AAIPNEQGVQVDNLGSALYISPKVSKTLFAQLYLMDDPFNNYPTINEAHVQDDSLVGLLKQQAAGDDFVYYGGLRGPIKIWKVDYPENVITRDEFLIRPTGWDSLNGPWALLDNIKFTS
ncbi:MAG: hypothetical protein WD876_00385, partial [Candidatus Pacearchaeota archaeon]